MQRSVLRRVLTVTVGAPLVTHLVATCFVEALCREGADVPNVCKQRLDAQAVQTAVECNGHELDHILAPQHYIWGCWVAAEAAGASVCDGATRYHRLAQPIRSHPGCVLALCDARQYCSLRNHFILFPGQVSAFLQHHSLQLYVYLNPSCTSDEIKLQMALEACFQPGVRVVYAHKAANP